MFAPVSTDVEICYQTFGARRRRPAAAGDGPGRADDLVGRRLLHAGSPQQASTSSATTTATPAAPRGSPGASRARQLVRAFATGRGRAPYSMSDLAGDGARPARPPRHRGGPRRRHLHGRHDRADDGDRAPGAGALADQHHVDDRAAHRRLAEPRPAADADRTAARRQGGLRRAPTRSCWQPDRLARLPDRRRRAAQARRGHLRPRRLRQRRAAPDAGASSPSPTAPCGCAASASPRSSSTAWPTRWCT